MVHYRKYRVEAVTQWQVRDQVQGNHFEGFCILGHWNSIQWRFVRVGAWFVLLADSATFDIIGDPGPHSWPRMVLSHFFVRLISA